MSYKKPPMLRLTKKRRAEIVADIGTDNQYAVRIVDQAEKLVYACHDRIERAKPGGPDYERVQRALAVHEARRGGRLG